MIRKRAEQLANHDVMWVKGCGTGGIESSGWARIAHIMVMLASPASSARIMAVVSVGTPLTEFHILTTK